jgi:hypothetical protein
MMRRILGRWSEASSWVRSPIWARTRSVVQPTVCRSGRVPASISTITWANCLGNAVAWLAPAWPAAPGVVPAGAAVPARAAVAAAPGGRSRPGAGSGAARPGGPAVASTWLLACGLVAAASRATGHAAPWVSQSYGGQPAGTVMSRSLEEAGGSGEVCWPGAGGSGGVCWPGAVGGTGVRVLDGMFRLPGPENANNRERRRRSRSYQAPAGLVLPQATDISASCLVTELSPARRATFPD